MPKFPKDFDRAAFMRCLDSGLTADQILDTLLDLKKYDLELPILDVRKPALDMPENVQCSRSRYKSTTSIIVWEVESTQDYVLRVWQEIYREPRAILPVIPYRQFEALGTRDIESFRLREPIGLDLVVSRAASVYAIRYSLDFVDDKSRRSAAPMLAEAKTSMVRKEPVTRAFDFSEEEA